MTSERAKIQFLLEILAKRSLVTTGGLVMNWSIIVTRIPSHAEECRGSKGPPSTDSCSLRSAFIAAVEGITSSSTSDCSVRFSKVANKIDDTNAEDIRRQLREIDKK